MAQIGWIKLDRRLLDHYLWQGEPFTKGQAWIDLLLMACHDEHKFLLGYELIETQPGQIITSEKKLMERWQWGKGKTIRFLELLEKDGMIIKKADRKKTVINIVNWGTFQNSQTTSGPQTDHKRTDGGPIADTYKNVKNVKNVKKCSSTPENIITFSGISAEQKAELISKYGATAVNDKLERIKQYKVKDVYSTLCKWLQEDSAKTKKRKNGFKNLDQREIGADQMAEIEKELLRH